MTALRFFSRGDAAKARGHQGYLNLGAINRTIDHQALAVDALVKERARRALLAQCERAPFGWELG